MFPNPFPQNSITDWQLFFAAQDTTTTRGFRPWLRPQGASWVYIFGIGSGGGGGAGFTASASAAGGGGGGGAGGLFRCLIPAWQLPEVLFVRPGMGGTGGISGGAAATAGVASYIGLQPSSAVTPILTLSGGGLGGAGSASAGGTAGTPANTSNNGPLAGSLFISTTGNAAAAGGAQTGANGGNAGTTSAVPSGGSGGGGTQGTANYNGGDINSGIDPSLGSGFPSGNGPNGYGYNAPLDVITALQANWAIMFSGGAGGGSSYSGVAGFGGNGAYGSGGGGGGAGATGGNGGNGGDGLIVIGAF